MASRRLDPAFRRDLLRLGCFFAALSSVGLLFLGTPALTLPTLGSIVLVTLFSPWITAIERQGFSRRTSILILFTVLSAVTAGAGFLVARNWQQEWLSFQASVPNYFSETVEQLSRWESKLRVAYPSLQHLKLAETLSNRGDQFGSWFAEKLPGYIGDLLGCLVLVPILTFCLLSEGRAIKRRFFQLVPNRFFESVYSVSYGVSSALSDFLRAKLIEGFLVGLITSAGLVLVHAPYAFVLGFWAGLTNIIPYVGPILGAVPGILIVSLDSHGDMSGVWAIVSVYGIANLIDTLMIFPGIVAKLVKLNPLVLIASVVLGQYYYGILGMLVSIPIAAVIKVVLCEFYIIIYGFSPDTE